MKLRLIFMVLFLTLPLLITACNFEGKAPHHPSPIVSLPNEGHYLLVVLADDELYNNYDEYREDLRNNKVNSTSIMHNPTNYFEYFRTTELPLFIIYDHRSEIFRTPDLNEAIEYIAELNPTIF